MGYSLKTQPSPLRGRIPVKEEEVEEVVKGVHRPGHQGEHRIWMASDRKVIKTEGKRKYRRIVPMRPLKSLMLWDQAGYKAQSKKNLEDIRAKLSRILVQEKVISGGPLFDLCGQRSDEEGGSCDASRQNICLKIKHLKESYLVGLCGLNLLTHEKLEIRIRKDLAPNHAKRPKSIIRDRKIDFGILIYT